MIKELIKLADHLDSRGLYKEADYVDALVKKSQILEKMTKPIKVIADEIIKFYEKNTRVFSPTGGAGLDISSEGIKQIAEGMFGIDLSQKELQRIIEYIRSATENAHSN